MTWQDDITPEQWDERQALARKAAKHKKGTLNPSTHMEEFTRSPLEMTLNEDVVFVRPTM